MKDFNRFDFFMSLDFFTNILSEKRGEIILIWLLESQLQSHGKTKGASVTSEESKVEIKRK